MKNIFLTYYLLEFYIKNKKESLKLKPQLNEKYFKNNYIK